MRHYQKILGGIFGFFAAWIPFRPFPLWWATKHFNRSWTFDGNVSLTQNFLLQVVAFSSIGFLLGYLILPYVHAKSRTAFFIVGLACVATGLAGLLSMSGIFETRPLDTVYFN